MKNKGRDPARPRRGKAGALLVSLLLSAALSACGKEAPPELELSPPLCLFSAAADQGLTRALALARLEEETVYRLRAQLGLDGRAPGRDGFKKQLNTWGAYGREGTAGRLIIPSAGINVALNLPGYDAQGVTDAPDSACWMEYPCDLNAVIGDHVNQEFSTLFRVRPGDVCSIIRHGREYRYTCVSTGYGSNVETDVLDAEGGSLFQYGSDRLCMYTCANGWRYVFIAAWQAEDRPLHLRSPFPETESVILIDES